MAIDMPMRTAIVSHDAGGAEVLSSYVRRHDLDWLYVLEGPALKVFERKLGPIKNITLEDAISQSRSIICSTSWQSDIEFNAIKLAREVGKRSVAFLDHWVNYRERFSRSGVTVLPDEIWVGDAIAEAMAKKTFPTTTISLVENPYFLDMQQEFSVHQMNREPCSNFIKILYICEPISAHAFLRHGDARIWGYVEEEALHYFLSNISALGHPIEHILIRPHPSEPIDKYNWIQHAFSLPIQFGGGRPLLEEIADSDVVVGCESVAMVVALLANKKVISCIPPGGRSCMLPHSKIIHLQNILENKRLVYENNERRNA
jgi:hypothetical protein